MSSVSRVRGVRQKPMDTPQPEPIRLTAHEATRADIDLDEQQTIACTICGAIYTPLPEYQYLLQAPRMALESAFMSMCHFCFRCRRPSCPCCWDNVHGVCGLCTRETHLPFRTQAKPLRGLLFSPIREAQSMRKHTPPIRLYCIHTGIMQQELPIDFAETQELKIISSPIDKNEQRRKDAITDIPTTPPRPRHTRVLTNISEDESNVQEKLSGLSDPPQKRARHWQEILLTIALILLLLGLLTIILAAWLSPGINIFISGTLSVDIHAQIAYLLQLTRQRL